MLGKESSKGSRRKDGKADGECRGLSFGTGFYLLVDEIGNPALGLTPGPGAFPWQAHARGLVAHLAFGVTTEVVLNLME